VEIAGGDRFASTIIWIGRTVRKIYSGPETSAWLMWALERASIMARIGWNCGEWRELPDSLSGCNSIFVI